jgi:hypothetical protein
LPERGLVYECPVDQIDWWGISRYFKVIEPGEQAYVWQSIDYRSSQGVRPRGIYATATIASVPSSHSRENLKTIEILQKQDSAIWADREAETHQKQKPILLIRYDANVSPPLTAEEAIKAGLEELGVLRFTHADIYKLSDREAVQIEGMLRGRLVI